MATYTSISKIEDLLQITIDEASIPDENAVSQWITEFEARIEELALGSHTVTDQYIDVPLIEKIDKPYKWTFSNENAKLRFDLTKGVIVPLGDVKSPIISITALYKNDEDPDDPPNWEQLTEGPGDGSHFMLLKSGRKEWGYALWFYDEEPEEGPKRLKLDYTYGFNIDSNILSDYCTMGVAIKVLLARMGTNEADGLAYLEGGDLGSYMNTNYRERIAILKQEMREIEEKYFPSSSKHSEVSAVIF
ncbi:MAG: hypothetical protein ACTSVD_10665 [Candidatus Thorarchaeota archaeon]